MTDADRLKTDEYLRDIVVAAIRRRGIDMERWVGTRLWDQGDAGIKAKFSRACAFDDGELPIVYAHVDAANWTLMTTRKVWSSVDGQVSGTDVADVTEHCWGDFKGIRSQQPSERGRLRLRNGETLWCPYETGKPSMGPIYALRTLRKVVLKTQTARSAK